MSSNGNGYHHGNGYGAPAAEETNGDLLPPQNIEAEQSLLGGLLLDNKRFASVLNIPLEAAHLYRAAHQILYRAMVDLYLRGSPVNGVTVADELEARHQLKDIGGLDLLREVAGAAPHAENVEFFAGMVIERWRRRQMIEAGEEAIRAGYSNEKTAAELMEEHYRRISLIEWRTDADAELLDQVRPWPQPLGADAFHGLAGDLIRTIEPHTEADPAAILFQFLAGIGNLFGRRPHWRVEATRHHLNLFVCLAGKTSKARKGTSFDHIRWLLERVDPAWAATRIGNGYTSGEGLIVDVMDDLVQGGTVTPGVTDKRLFWVESEFGGCLTIMARDGNTLSAVTRQAWDGGQLNGRSKHRPVRATGAHVSSVGHITVIEANDLMTSTNAANGFGNRFLWVCAERSKLLPHGGAIHTVNFAPLLLELKKVLEFVNLDLDPEVPLLRCREANAIWESVYPGLSAGRPGLLGAMTSRAEAQVMRLAAIYAVLDLDKYIRPPHLNAALACWRYCEESARFIFGERMGDPEADKLFKAIREGGQTGVTRNDIRRKVFGGHIAATKLDEILGRLLQSGLIEPASVQASDGRGKIPTAWREKNETKKVCAIAPFAPLIRYGDTSNDSPAF